MSGKTSKGTATWTIWASAAVMGGLMAIAAGAGPANPAGGGAAATQAGAAAQVADVHLCVPPKGGDIKALDNARIFLGRPAARTRGGPLETPDISTLAVRPLTALYSIDLASLAQGKGLEAATARNTFEYAALVEGKVRATVSIEIVGETAGQFRGMDGPDVLGLVEGMDTIGKLEQVRGGAYELRELELPPSVVTPHPTRVLWLKADKGGGDWIYTLKERWYPGDMKQQTLFKEADFLKTMHDWADKSMKAPPMPPGAGGGGTAVISLSSLTGLAPGVAPASPAATGAAATQGGATQASATTQVAWLSAAPKGGEAVALAAAKQFLPNLQPRRRGTPVPAMDLSTLTVRPLTAAYAIDLASLALGQGLDAATPRKSFKYAALVGGKVGGVVSVEVVGDKAGKMLSVASGDPAGLAEGIDALTKLELVRNGPVEVRQLELPPASTFPHPTQVLWLKSGKGAGDWVYTLKEPAYPGGLKTQTLYTAADLLKAMQTWADAAMKAPPMPPGAGG